MAFERDPHKLFPHDYLMRYLIAPLIPRCISPNMITMFRMCATPFELWFLFEGWYALAVPFFIFLAFTDTLDGSLARLRNSITPWGTFYDPLADKLLIGSVVLLIVAKYVNLVFALTIVIIESFILLIAYFRRLDGKITSANIIGKTKMLFQVLGVSILLIAVWQGYDIFVPISVGTLSLAIVLAVICLFSYGL